MLKALFFDLGNTLLFYDYDFLKGVLEERYKIDVGVDELEATHKIITSSIGSIVDNNFTHERMINETYRRWFKSLGFEEDKIGGMIKYILGHPFRHLFWARMEAGTQDELNWFKDRGYKLGVISNSEGQVRRLVEHLGLDSKFDLLVDSHEVGFCKPDKKIFEYALGKIGVSPNEAVHIGDIFEIDVMGAKGVGISPILIDRDGFHKNKDCTKIKSLGELKNLPMFKTSA